MKTSPGKTVLIVILSIIVIAAGIAGIIFSVKDKSKETKAQADQPSESVVISEDEISKDHLLKDKYPEVNLLIKKYRDALTNGDVNSLKEVYNTEDTISSDVLSSTSEVIEGYSNTTCYTKRGLEENSYFVFIYDHLKIHDISTTVPNLTMVYVKTSPEGALYIYRGEKNPSTGAYEYDAATLQYIQQLYEDEEVVELMTTVYHEKEEACAKDEALKNFVNGLSTPETESLSETGESQTETSTDQTESQPEETAETVAAE